MQNSEYILEIILKTMKTLTRRSAANPHAESSNKKFTL